MFVNNIVRH